MTTAQEKERVGWLLFFGGLAMMLAEYLLHVWSHFRGPEYRISLGATGIGAVVTFIGWFWLNRKDALDGGGFVVNAFTSVLGVLRSGRRATDPTVVVPPAAPVVPPAPPVDPHADAIPDLPHVPAPEKGP